MIRVLAASWSQLISSSKTGIAGSTDTHTDSQQPHTLPVISIQQANIRCKSEQGKKQKKKMDSLSLFWLFKKKKKGGRVPVCSLFTW